MIREADIDGDGQVNYEGGFTFETYCRDQHLSIFPFFRIRHHDDLKVICYNVSLWNYSGSGWLRRNYRFIDFTNTIFFCGFPIIILQFKSQNSPTRLCWFCSKELLAILACHNVEPLTCIFLLSVYMWCHLSFLPFNIWLKVLSTIFVYKLLFYYQHQRIKVLLDQMSP